MGYVLQAFIGESQTLKKLTFQHAQVVPLLSNLSLIPMTGELFDEINQFRPGDSIAGILFLNINIEREVLLRVGDSPIAYVTADYAGGHGGQCGVFWMKGRQERVRPFAPGVINEILKQFGIKRTDRQDEFEIVGLGRNRSTEDWLSSEVP